jgi:hypothetical protein
VWLVGFQVQPLFLMSCILAVFFPWYYFVIKNIFEFYFYLIVLFVFIVIVGARDVSVGTDTENYYKVFDIVSLHYSSWYEYKWEPLYQGLNLFVYDLGGGASHTLLLSAAITLALVFGFVWKVSPNKTLSIILFFGVFGFLLSFNVVRHSIATGFIVYGLYFHQEKRIKLSFMFFLCAILFHYSSFLFLLIYLLMNWLSNLKFYFTLWIVSLFFLFIPHISHVVYFLLFDSVEIFFSEYYSQYLKVGEYIGEVGYRDIFMQVLFITYMYTLLKSRTISNFNIYLMISMAGVILSNFTAHVQYMNRVVVFFEVFNVIAIPIVIATLFTKKSAFFISVVIAVLAVVFFFKAYYSGSNGIYPYSNWFFEGS